MGEGNNPEVAGTKPVPNTKAGVERGEKAEPSGYNGGNPATAGPGSTAVRSRTPENNAGTLNPSAPGNTGTTPGSTPDET